MESIKNHNTNKPEEARKWFYFGDVVRIEEFNEGSTERPNSVGLQKAHPELYDYLMRKEGAKKFNVALLHIDGLGMISKKFVHDELSKYDKKTLESKEKQSEILKKLFSDLQNKLIESSQSDFKDIAKQIRYNPKGKLSEVEYFTAYSILANKQDVAKKFGFEIFKIDNDEGKFDSFSNKQRNMVKDEISKFINIKYLAQSPQIALLSKESLLELYKD